MLADAGGRKNLPFVCVLAIHAQVGGYQAGKMPDIKRAQPVNYDLKMNYIVIAFLLSFPLPAML